MSRAKSRVDPGQRAFRQAWSAVHDHPLFAPMTHRQAYVTRDDGCPDDGWAVVDSDGHIHAHPTRVAPVDEWVWVLAHCLVHLGLGHLSGKSGGNSGGDTDRATGRPAAPDEATAAACDAAVNRFLAALRLGRPPMPLPAEYPATEEQVLAARWRASGVPVELRRCGTAGSHPDTRIVRQPSWQRPVDWPDLFAAGLAGAVSAAVEVAGGARTSLTGDRGRHAVWDQALRWFVSSYPLLGALATAMTIVADADLARGWDIGIAAVNAAAGEIYVNPLAALTEAEWRFVLAHEMLHAALRHGDRVGGRDPYLWNVAADFVINGWLVEMGVGTMPDGLLHDPQLAGLSAEAVYDRITTDLRRFRKLATLRGATAASRGAGDVLDEPLPHDLAPGRVTDLDDFYRRALLSGLSYHDPSRRGLLPAGLVEEIRALEQPPLEWDAALARWFEAHVPASERRRSYARASRRQSSTPDIPRPAWVRPDERVSQPTFGVVLDTSGSMDNRLLGKALGAIASYSLARDVPAARVVFCDAAAYDAGYLPVEEIAGRVRVRGRGGTVLQPGITLLERAPDFPADGPILVITDGWCDVLRIRREHAFLIPAGAALPFRPRGPVFRVR